MEIIITATHVQIIVAALEIIGKQTEHSLQITERKVESLAGEGAVEVISIKDRET